MRFATLRSWQPAPGKRFTPIFLFVAAFVFALFSTGSGSLLSASSLAEPQGAKTAVETKTVEYESSGVKIKAFLAKPLTAGKHPAVIIIHNKQGLIAPFRQMARNLASAGYVALAPDLLPRTESSKSQPPMMASAFSPHPSVGDVEAAFAYLQKDPDVEPSKISSIGFGWGGWRAFRLAALEPDLYRAVIYCGSPLEEGFNSIHAPVLAQYAQFDFRVTGNALWIDNTMKEAGKQFTYYVYPKVFRNFFDSQSPDYNPEAAKLAWARTLQFLEASGPSTLEHDTKKP